MDDQVTVTMDKALEIAQKFGLALRICGQEIFDIGQDLLALQELVAFLPDTERKVRILVAINIMATRIAGTNASLSKVVKDSAEVIGIPSE